MVKAYDGKLAEFVIPVEELGFDPLVPTFTEWRTLIIKICNLYFLSNESIHFQFYALNYYICSLIEKFLILYYYPLFINSKRICLKPSQFYVQKSQ